MWKYGGRVVPPDNFFRGGAGEDAGHHPGHYEGWRHTRITKLVSLLGGEEWFKGKAVLELACGFGHTSELISQWGALVTLAEGREPHAKHAAQHHAPPGRPVIHLNQDHRWNLDHDIYPMYVRQPSNEIVEEKWDAKPNPVKFDLVIHWGVLYHLNNWQQDLECALRHTDLLCLESEIADSLDPTYDQKVSESWADAALSTSEGGSSRGSRPSASHVENVLDSLGCTYTRYDDAALNFRYHKYDWKVNDTGEFPPGQRRFWLVRK